MEQGGFTRPKIADWDVFEEAVVKVFYSWDMTQHALDDEWSGDSTEDNVERVLDYLLENFAERWIQGRGTNADAVSEFLVDTIKDYFDVEIPASIAFPLAQLMVTLHDECRNKIFTGANVILGPEMVQSIFEENKPVEKKELVKMEDEEEEEKAVKKTTETEAEVVEKPVVAEEDDGWTTVDVKPKKGNKKKGKKLE